MSAVHKLITDQLDIWTAADTEKKSGRGRASGNANSVYGIKKLRELILELAVRGKLVPQDPNDEPASKFLDRIDEIKKILLANKKIKKNKNTANFDSSEAPFRIPKNWRWEKLGTLSTKLTDGSHNPPKDAGEGIPMLSSQNVNFGKIDFSTPSRFVIHEDFELEDARTQIEPDDVLLTIVASLGRPAVVPKDAPKFVLQRSVAVIKTGLFPHYLCLHLASPYCLAYYDEHGKGTAQKGIYLGQLSELPIAVPPLAEQHRIVAKVDELMALCDQLEAQHNNAADAHEQLVSNLLSTLTQSQDAADFNANWQRIATHFDTLFTTESSIDALKQTLLQLAVMGKLVPQNPNDEPASELLKRIQAEKAKLVAEGKLKKEHPFSPLDLENGPFSIPNGWKWSRLAELMSIVTDGDHQAPPKAESGVPFLVIGNLNTGEVLLENCRYVSIEYYDNLDYIKKPVKNDLLYTVTGSYGIPIKVKTNEKFCVQRHVAILKTTSATPIDYLMFLLKSKYAFEYASGIATGIAQKTVPLTGLRSMPIALPPESEQNRIVKKIEQLMNQCEKLKSSLNISSQVKKNLTDILITRSLN